MEQEGIEALYVIGDASAPRMIVDSIFDGHRLAREIDSPQSGDAAAVHPRAAAVG